MADNYANPQFVPPKREWKHNTAIDNIKIAANLIFAGVWTLALFSGLRFMATELDMRRYASGALGAYFAANIVIALKVMLWGQINHLLGRDNRGVSFGALCAAMSTIAHFDLSILFKTGFIGAASCLVWLLEITLPSALALFFSTGFVTEQISTGADERGIEISEIGGCDSGQCIATSATLLGLLSWQINNGRHLDGASLSPSDSQNVGLSKTTDVNLFYPDIPTEAVDAYWNNPPGNSTVFSVESLPGLLVEATTTEIDEYTAYSNKIATTVSNISLSYEARQLTDEAFRMELIGQTVASSGTVTFLFNASIMCATADTTITVKSGILDIEATNLQRISECAWDNSSFEMWRSFESSLGIAIRYDYNVWFSRLRNNSTYSRHISELLGSVVAHRLSTGDATIKRIPGTFKGEITYLRDRERVATWTGYIAAGCMAFIVIRAIFLFLPCNMLRGDLQSFCCFLSPQGNPEIAPNQVIKFAEDGRCKADLVQGQLA